MTRIALLPAVLAAVVLATPAWAAQTNYLVLGPTPSTYAPLVGGTPVTFTNPDEGAVLLSLPPSLNFRFYGVPVSSVYLGTNGFISFSSDLASCAGGAFNCYLSSSSLPSGSPRSSLFFWWADINQRGSTVSTGFETVNGAQVFTIDYHNIFYYSDSAAIFSVKIRLYQGGGKIEVVYGPSPTSNSSFLPGAVAGVQSDTTPQLSATGLACSNDPSRCTITQFPGNSSITYLYADKPDLDWGAAQLSSVTAGPDAGDPVSVVVDATVRNDGTQDAGPFDSALYLSSSPTLDGGGTLLSTRSVSALAVNDGAPLNFTGSFPRPPNGKYYLVLVADPVTGVPLPDGGPDLGAVDEIDETNNLKALTLYMGTDLTGMVDAPPSGDVGATLPVHVKIINQGVDAAPVPFKYSLWMSADATLDAQDLLVATSTVQPGDLPYDQTLNLAIPQNVPASDFYLFLEIDPTSAALPSGQILEADETNNILSVGHTIHANLPDFTVTRVQVLGVASPNPTLTRAFFGQDVRLRVTVQNVGQAVGHDVDVGIYLSGGVGASVITTHRQLLDDPTIPTLPPGASVTLDLVETVPTVDTTRSPPVLWSAGDFYFGAIANSSGAIGEISLSNNIGKQGPIHIRTTAPDFTPVELDVPQRAAVGEVAVVTRVIRNVGNLGNAAAGETACPYRYYLSANATITTEDIPLQIITAAGNVDEGSVKLEIGADSRATERLQLPSDLTPGTYHLGILLNPLGTVDEIDLTNNALDGSNLVQVVAGPLAISTAALPDAVLGVGYAVQLSAQGGMAPSWSLLPGSTPPPGLTLSSTGLLSGTPTAAGTSAFVVQAQSGTTVARASLTLTVNPVSGPLEVLTHNLPSAVASNAYLQRLAAVGGVGSLHWSLLGGALPPGLSLADDGTVAGSPGATADGAPAVFMVAVTDGSGAMAMGTVSLRVVSASSLRITTGALPPGVVGQSYPASGSPEMTVTNVHPPADFRLSAGALPPGLSLKGEPTRAELTGRPTTAGIFVFSVTVTDATGQEDVHDYAVAIQPSGLALQALPLPTVKPGAAYDADLSTIDGTATHWGVYSGQLPPGITLDASGHLAGTCDAKAPPGNYAFLVEAVSRKGQKGYVTETITVLDAKRGIPTASGCGSTSTGATLLALLPVLGLLLRRRRLGMAPVLLLGAMALVGLPGRALAAYTATTTTVTYVPITGGQQITSGHGVASTLQLPFNFRFFGQTYSAVSVGTGGFLTFVGDATTLRPDFATAPIIAPWGDNLEIDPTSGASLTYVINGVTPNRELVIQWANANNFVDAHSFSGTALTQFNFRVRLHESGQLDFEYGSQGALGSSTQAIAGISDGASNSVAAVGCSGGFGTCPASAFPSNTRVVFVAGTDLAVDQLTTTGVAYQQTTTNLVAAVSNPGGQDVPQTSVRFVLSTDAVLGGSDDVVLGDVGSLSLPAGQSRSVTFPFSVGSLAPGTYFFFASVNPDSTVVEESRSNNTFGPARLDVLAPQPDLTVTQVQASPHTAAPGGTLSVALTLRNIAATASPGVPYAIYLSSNDVITQADTLLSRGTTAPLAAGASVSATVTVTVPAATLPGSAFVGVIANPDLNIPEQNALNDSAFDPVAVKVVSPQLTLDAAPGGTLPATSVGAVYRYVFTAQGGDGHYTFTPGATLPGGLVLAADGTLQGRPTQPAASATVTVSVADGAGHSSTGNFSLAIGASAIPLTVLSNALAAGEYGKPFIQPLRATGGVPPYQWSVVDPSNPPPGLRLAPDGTLEGQPNQAGTFTFTAQVQDAATPRHTATASLSLTVSGALGRLRVASPSLPDAVLDTPYAASLGVAGGVPPYFYQFPYCPAGVDGGAGPVCKPVTRFPLVATDGPPQNSDLPVGLYFSCTGQGVALLTSRAPNIPFGQDGGSPCYDSSLPADAPVVPREAGSFAIPARISDSAGNILDVTFTLRVGSGQGLTIRTAQLPDALSGQPYRDTLQVDSPATSTPVHWTLACAEQGADGLPLSPCPEGLPPGLALKDDGTVSGTPTDASGKVYSFLVRAADGEQRVDVRALAITSKASTPAPKKSGCGAAPGDAASLLGLLPLAALLLRRRRGSAGALLALGLCVLVPFSVGCGKKPNSRCTGVTCVGGTVCDLGDGLCKCGGEGGVVCSATATCDVKARACTEPAHDCAGVRCSGNTACDPADGTCKCGGAGGVTCTAGQVCDSQTRSCTSALACAGVVCGGSESCDPGDGRCKCAGAVCGAGQLCQAGDGGAACVTSRCAGVHCTGDTSCDPASGACLCGGFSCVAGQTCLCASDAGSCSDAARSCQASTRCASVSCTGGSSCDPTDGVCKCGGPGGPVCGAGQACDVTVGACLGGDRCRGVTCNVTGTSCDPEDGKCKCGGQGGVQCTTDQTCFSLAQGYACRVPCSPLNPVCPTGLACYFDETGGASSGSCQVPGLRTGPPQNAQTCQASNDCVEHYHCGPLVGHSFPGNCERYCAVDQGAGGCTGSLNCVQIGNGVPIDADGGGLGACR
jgi:hypothetical protein